MQTQISGQPDRLDEFMNALRVRSRRLFRTWWRVKRGRRDPVASPLSFEAKQSRRPFAAASVRSMLDCALRPLSDDPAVCWLTGAANAGDLRCQWSYTTRGTRPRRDAVSSLVRPLWLKPPPCSDEELSKQSRGQHPGCAVQGRHKIGRAIR
jgi:hypothetical protein